MQKKNNFTTPQKGIEHNAPAMAMFCKYMVNNNIQNIGEQRVAHR